MSDLVLSFQYDNEIIDARLWDYPFHCENTDGCVMDCSINDHENIHQQWLLHYWWSIFPIFRSLHMNLWVIYLQMLSILPIIYQSDSMNAKFFLNFVHMFVDCIKDVIIKSDPLFCQFKGKREKVIEPSRFTDLCAPKYSEQSRPML